MPEPMNHDMKIKGLDGSKRIVADKVDRDSVPGYTRFLLNGEEVFKTLTHLFEAEPIVTRIKSSEEKDADRANWQKFRTETGDTPMKDLDRSA